MIYWRGINIGDRRFYDEIANIKSAILFQFTWHKIANTKFANFFPQANLPDITPANKSSCTVLSFVAGVYEGLAHDIPPSVQGLC